MFLECLDQIRSNIIKVIKTESCRRKKEAKHPNTDKVEPEQGMVPVPV